MRERDDDVVDGGQVRLGGLPALGARRAVAHVANGELAGKGGEIRLGENLIDQAEVLADHNGAAIAHGDARRLLPAVLERLQAEVRDARDVAPRGPDAEDAAFLVQRIAVRRPHLPRRCAARRLHGHIEHTRSLPTGFAIETRTL